MKTLIAWLTRNQRCACGGFKLSRAYACFDCTQRLEADIVRVFEADEQAKRAA